MFAFWKHQGLQYLEWLKEMQNGFLERSLKAIAVLVKAEK